MPRRKFIDKKNATTFQLVHRAQNDPLIHDENAPSMVFAEKQSKHRFQDPDDETIPSSSASIISGSSRASKVRHRGDLEDEFGTKVRPNEGEAAEHGIFFDDTRYDYMQHMRDLGQGGGQVTWVEAAPKAVKGKQKLEDALKDLDLGRFDDAQSIGQSSMASSVARSLLPEEMLPSEFVQKRTYQDQQDVPDEIAGFQPDMDSRLREVLEALDDEAYVDDEEDLFAELTLEGREVEQDEWDRLGEQQMFAEDELDDGWESDHTIRAITPDKEAPLSEVDAAPPSDALAQPPADPTGGTWLNEFKKFKSEKVPAAPSHTQSGLSSLASGRRKKRKGAQTSTSNYSMSSSALVRTAQQTLLDARFDKIEEEYAADEDEGQFDDAMSAASGMTGASKTSRVSHYSNISGVSGISSYSRATDSEAPQLQRTDFNSIMDDFLGTHSKAGRKFVKKSGPQTGMEQLDEIRSGLGPAMVRGTRVRGPEGQRNQLTRPICGSE